jgi:hypothetical protein
MVSVPWRRPLIGGAILIALLVAAFLGNFALTSVVEGPKFRAMLEKETAKGMHFQEVHYAPITRGGLFGMRADSGKGSQGLKTLQSLSGEQVSGAFNPLGIFLKRWQLQFLHFDRGFIRIQKTTGNPDEKPPPGQPWYLFFWPSHVYLKDVTCDHADVIFKLQDKDSGIHGTYLEITPNGRDFEYDAKGGTFTTPDTPALTIEHIHLLVRKPRMTCPVLILGDDPAHPEEQVSVTGEAGLQKDRGIQLKADFNSLQVAPWLPAKVRSGVRGHFSGHFEYQSTGTGLETATAQGNLVVKDGELLPSLKVLRTYIAATKSPDPGDVPLTVCQTGIKMEKGAFSLENLDVESKGIFRLVGSVRIAKDKTISGEVELGLTEPYLRWLPSLEQDVFNKVDGPYHWTTVRIFGTTSKPEQDLSARITRDLERHPFEAVKLLFNSSSVWFD